MSVFTVTMLNALRPDFERWLAERGLKIAEIPDPDLEHPLIVVPILFPEIAPLEDT